MKNTIPYDAHSRRATPQWAPRVARACGALLLGMAGLAVAARGQGVETTLGGVGGTRYMVAFPDTVQTAGDDRYIETRIASEASLMIYSGRKNRVRIADATGYSTEILLDSAEFRQVRLPNPAIVRASAVPTRWAFSVDAEYPIVVICYLAGPQGVEAWLPQPVAMWGMKYRVAAIPGEIINDLGFPGEIEVPMTPKPAPAEIMVIAAHDGTHLTLTPPRGVAFEGDPPTTVTLDAGDVYQVRSVVGLGDVRQQDIAATRIEADKPIAVISGNTRAQANATDEGIKSNVYKNLMLEWLRPVEQYGRQFVYMPTADAHRAGIGAPAPRKWEYVRLCTDAPAGAGGSFSLLDSGATAPAERRFVVARDSMAELSISPFDAVMFASDEPTQAVMHSSAVVSSNGTTPCFRGLPCISYSGWAPYMVELVPREQWASFAPYYAPVNPGAMKHYINVVTDSASAHKIRTRSGSLFVFNRRVPGTDLVWGTAAVAPGTTNWLAGEDGATFGGFVYGLMEGSEDYRPGIPGRKKDGPATASGGRDEAPAPLHPAEFEEHSSVSYGYPLVSLARIIGAGDSIAIDTVKSCTALAIKARSISVNPAGFRSAALDPAVSVNTRLTFVDPGGAGDVSGRTSIELLVESIDPRHRASGVVVITDRTGKSWRVAYSSDAQFLVFSPHGVTFDSIPDRIPAERMVSITNTLDHPLTIDMLRMARGNEGFEIVATNPHGPAEQPPSPIALAPGDSMTVTLRALVPGAGRSNAYVDSLMISYDCGWESLPVDARRTAASVARVADAEGYRIDASVAGSTAAINYEIGRRGGVRIAIYDETGRRVATLLDAVREAGGHGLEWDASGRASGVYFCVIESGSWRRSVPLVIAR